MRGLIYLVLLILAGMAVSSTLSFALWSYFGIDMNVLLSGAEIDRRSRLFVRLGLMLNHAGIFLIPAILYCKYFEDLNFKEYFKMVHFPKVTHLILWGLVILSSYPFIAQLTIWNMALPIPEWMRSSQNESFAILEIVLQMDSFLELIFSLILVGVLAAIGEELIFRGILQSSLINMMGKTHIAIIIAAFIFGGFHMQFERILPLSLLGLILGYSYYYTQSLFAPIILHFINNSFQVLSFYILSETGNKPDVDVIPQLSSPLIIASIVLTIMLAYGAVKIAPKRI